MLEESGAAGAPAETPTETSEPSLSDARGAVWDKYEQSQDEPDGPTPDVAEPAGKPAESAEGDAAPSEGEATEQEAPEAPGYLPRAIKEQWGDIPDSARDAFSSAYRDLSDKLGRTSREVNALSPIRDSLTACMKANPAIADMKPEEVAQQLPGLVEAGQRIQRDPVGTLMGLAKQYKVADQLAAQFGRGGDQALSQRNQALEAEIADLRKNIDPQRLRGQFEMWNAETELHRTIQDFQATAPKWQEVEPYLSQFVPVAEAKLGQDASNTDLLKAAYEMAVQVMTPEQAPQSQPAEQAAPVVDPQKAQEALRAKNVNVKGRSSESAKPQSLRQARDEIWRKARTD